ncbi:MAG: hypothetical protein ACSLFK_10700 [Gemmatimonadaceae bacterium]
MHTNSGVRSSLNRVREIDLSVVGREMVESGRGKLVQASIVTHDGLNGPIRLWVSKAAPFIFKSEEILSDGRVITSLMVN